MHIFNFLYLFHVLCISELNTKNAILFKQKIKNIRCSIRRKQRIFVANMKIIWKTINMNNVQGYNFWVFSTQSYEQKQSFFSQYNDITERRIHSNTVFWKQKYFQWILQHHTQSINFASQAAERIINHLLEWKHFVDMNCSLYFPFYFFHFENNILP